MPTRQRLSHVTAALLLGCTALSLPSASEASGPSAHVGSVRVSFLVDNVNRSLLPCAADGERYRVRGRLVGPARLLHRRRLPAVTVYVHDFTTGAWFWRFPDYREHDLGRALANRGHVSLVLTRLGYRESDLTAGDRTCLGAQADMVDQVVDRLRAGRYRSTGRSPEAESVVLAGHSVGAGIAELAQASFASADGLVVMSWTDTGPSERAIQEAAVQTTVCIGGGDSRAARPGFAFFGQTRADLRELLFHSAHPDVQRAAVRRRNADPCGDVHSLGPLVMANNAATRQIDVPVLLMYGAHDVLVRPESRRLQERGYHPKAAVTSHVLADTGSALPFEATADRTFALLADWLSSTHA